MKGNRWIQLVVVLSLLSLSSTAVYAAAFDNIDFSILGDSLVVIIEVIGQIFGGLDDASPVALRGIIQAMFFIVVLVAVKESLDKLGKFNKRANLVIALLVAIAGSASVEIVFLTSSIGAAILAIFLLVALTRWSYSEFFRKDWYAEVGGVLLSLATVVILGGFTHVVKKWADATGMEVAPWSFELMFLCAGIATILFVIRIFAAFMKNREGGGGGGFWNGLGNTRDSMRNFFKGGVNPFRDSKTPPDFSPQLARLEQTVKQLESYVQASEQALSQIGGYNPLSGVYTGPTGPFAPGPAGNALRGHLTRAATSVQQANILHGNATSNISAISGQPKWRKAPVDQHTRLHEAVNNLVAANVKIGNLIFTIGGITP